MRGLTLGQVRLSVARHRLSNATRLWPTWHLLVMLGMWYACRIRKQTLHTVCFLAVVLQNSFCTAFKRSSPDFQTRFGYGVDPPNQANMAICSNQVRAVCFCQRQLTAGVRRSVGHTGGYTCFSTCPSVVLVCEPFPFDSG